MEIEALRRADLDAGYRGGRFDGPALEARPAVGEQSALARMKEDRFVIPDIKMSEFRGRGCIREVEVHLRLPKQGGRPCGLSAIFSCPL